MASTAAFPAVPQDGDGCSLVVEAFGVNGSRVGYLGGISSDEKMAFL
ncbi:hypothetical protein [Bradyrhizobium sp.]|nr:hypothetical protein [Bradyrhizobium sp.]